ncbi:MAG: hypothetical protein P1P64_01950 [Treponemataceae bacterium]
MKHFNNHTKLQVITKFIFVISLFSLFACQTTQVNEIDPFATIGEGADVYVFLPIDGNEFFLEKILGEKAQQKDIKTALERTEKLYAGIFTQKTSPRAKDETLICSIGDYPAHLADMIFKETNGWTKTQANNGVNYYSGGINSISIPNNKNSLLVIAKEPEVSMKPFLENANNEKFVTFSENYDSFVKTTTKDAVGIFIKNPNFLIAKILGSDLQLPVKASEIYLIKNTEENFYTYNFTIETGNRMTAFALNTILRAYLKADVRTSDAKVYIENGKLTSDKLSNLINKIFY